MEQTNNANNNDDSKAVRLLPVSMRTMLNAQYSIPATVSTYTQFEKRVAGAAGAATDRRTTLLHIFQEHLFVAHIKIKANIKLSTFYDHYTFS